MRIPTVAAIVAAVVVIAPAVPLLASHAEEAGTSRTPPGAAQRGCALPAGATWKVVPELSDDFDGDGLDRSKWGTKHWVGASKGVQFTGRNAVVEGGRLSIKVSKKKDPPDDGAAYLGGYVRGKRGIGGNTYTEVRARMVDHRARVNSAIWLHHEARPDTDPNVEIDMQEYLNPIGAPKQVRSALHLWPTTGEHQQLGHVKKSPNGPLDADFHCYGLERRGDRLNFYLDGKRYWSYDTTAHPELVTQRQPLILYIRGLPRPPVDEVLPAAMDVDHVRVYRAG